MNLRLLVPFAGALVLGLVALTFAGGIPGPQGAGSSGGSSSPVALLDGSQHSDTTAGTVARGDLVTGQGSTATWTRLAKGAAGTVLTSGGTDLAWSADLSLGSLSFGDVLIGDDGGLYVTESGGQTLFYVPSTGSLSVGSSGGGYATITSNSRFLHVPPATQECRLSLSSTDPVGEATGAGTVYLLPYAGDRVSLYDGTAWVLWTVPEAGVSLALSGLTASKPSDLFLSDSSGTLTLTGVAWTDATTRATALSRQNGVYVRAATSGGARYVGTVYVDGSNQATFSSANRGLWNESNRVQWESLVVDATDSWSYSTDAWQQANGSSANQIPILQGRKVDVITAHLHAGVSADGAASFAVGVGVDSTTTAEAGAGIGIVASGGYSSTHATYAGRPAEGYRVLAWLERTQQSGGVTVTWYGDSGGAGGVQSGMVVTSWH